MMPTHAHRTLRNTDHLIEFDEKPTEKPTEKYSVLVSILFGLNRSKPTDVLGKNRKTDRATFHFRFTTLVPLSVYMCVCSSHETVLLPVDIQHNQRPCRLFPSVNRDTSSVAT